MLVQEVANRVHIDTWDLQELSSAETAAWGALANLYANDWEPIPAANPAETPRELVGAQ